MVSERKRREDLTKLAELQPDDIRRIREKLGLSQVEAGELLGGGPRAFTKYESGTIKPTAATANLLRMVDATPVALATLTGKKLPPIESDGAKPFEVTGQHVAALSERKLVNLMRRLLAAEALSGELPMDGIHVAAVVTAPDGGEDAKIEWSGGPERTRFLPARHSQFQLKAAELTPADAGSEVLAAAGEIKPMVRAALENGGTYILVSARSYTNSKLKAREASVRKSLAGAGLKFRDDQVQFRDADQIALWVNAHPPVAAWLLEQTQPGLVGGFRDWSHWSGRYDNFPWIAEARLEPLRDRLRPLVAIPRGVARVLGLSGYGKSRLVHEALGPTPREEGNALPLSDLVLYAVESEVGSAAVKNIVQNLADASIRAIVVVDRCSGETHQDLAAMVKRASSRLSLITIDHELPVSDRVPDDTILVERADDSVIDLMLKQIVPDLPSEDQRRLVRFSQGFPQIAALLGQSWLREASIAGVSDTDLFDRIILGRKPSDPTLLREVGMLVGAFGLVGVKTPLTDLDVLASFSRDRSVAELRAGLDELVQRGVVQLHGRLASLQPKPLAMALTQQQWRRWEGRWDEILAGTLPVRLRVRAARQLALINNHEIASEVTRYVCRLNGPFASLDGIQQDGAAGVISALAEIDAEAVVNLLERVLGRLSREQLKAIEGDTRRHLVWGLEKIAFVEATFEKAALLLLALAAAENETWGNNATGQFKNLFPVFGANTTAGPEPRLRLLDELIAQNDSVLMPLVVDALLSGANLNSHSRTIGAEIHGSRPALKPWHPKLWKDVFDYVFACLDRLAEIALRHDALGARARARMSHSFRPLASTGHIDRIEGWVEKISAAHPYWPQALDALGDVLQYDADALKGDAAERVGKLIAVLRPKDLAGRTRFLVTEMPWDYPIDQKLGYEERGKAQVAAVEELVRDLVAHPDELLRLLPQMSKGSQRMAYAAGIAIAKFADRPHGWAKPIEAAVMSIPEADRNFALLVGFYTGLHPRDQAAAEEFKHRAAMSADLAPSFPMLSSSLGITAADVEVACEALRLGTVLPGYMINWTYGGVLAKLPPTAVAPVFDQLLDMDSVGYSVALDLMGMYVHGDAGRLEHLRPQIITFAKNVHKRPKRLGGSHMDEHHFEQIIGWLLKKGREDADARSVAIELANHAVSSPDDVDDLIRPLIPVLFSKFASIIWPIFGRAIVADRATGWRIQHLVGDSFTFADKKSPAILNVPEDILFAWCHANPEVGPAFLAEVLPVLTSQRPQNGGNVLHPFVKRLLDEFGDREDVLRKLVQNMHTFGWMGSRTTYYALYEAPLRSLENHPIGAVRRWSKTMLADMISAISAARTEDEEQQAHWNT